jgi:hypothetical protein
LILPLLESKGVTIRNLCGSAIHGQAFAVIVSGTKQIAKYFGNETVLSEF